MKQERAAVDVDDVLREELKAISSKRKRCNPEEDSQNPSNLFGIALSGGGIRSATVNLGVLKILNKCGILAMADYLSTVSGGGYIGGYVHARLKSAGQTRESFRELFDEKEIEHLKRFGFYLTPGAGLKKSFSQLRLFGAFVFSLFMNWIGILSLLLSLYFLLQAVLSIDLVRGAFPASEIVIALILAPPLYHFFFHGLRKKRLWSSDLLYSAEGVLLLLSLIYVAYRIIAQPQAPSHLPLLYSLFAFLFTGFFANPNIITMHRFYRDSLSAAYLKAAGKGERAIRLHELIPGRRPEDWSCAPYPLINTCLNLTGEKDESFKGAKSSDYFLLSPLYCGSKLTGYTGTGSPGYGALTLPTAIAVSGAAVNPAMGVKTKRILSFLMTLLDLKLGYWAINPKKPEKYPLLSWMVWWPFYTITELLGKMDTRKAMVNISDGGHIENLGVYELIRRRCRLIIAIDASADPDYSFADLKNLVIRARNELGVAINFRQEPEECIKPSPSRGFSLFHFVVADIEDLPGKGPEEKRYKGLLVYMKSSLRASQTYKRIQSEGYGYKLHHPGFPHESTADQFFDRAQWQAYYTLGRFMAGDLLKVDVTMEECASHLPCNPDSIEALYKFFDRIRDERDLEKHHEYWKK